VSSDVKPNFLRPRWRKVLSDLWDDKTRSALVVASIAVGAFAIGMIISAYSILGQDINRSYASVNPPNIVIQTDPFDKDLVRAIERLRGVKAAEGRRVIPIRARKGNDNWQNMTLVGLADSSGDINRLASIEGSVYPGKDQAVFSQNLMSVSGFHAGDQVEIELPDGAKHTLTVAGLVTDQTTSKPDADSTINAFVTMKTLTSWGWDSNFNQLYITVAGDGSSASAIAGVATTVKDQINDSQREVYRTDEKLSTEHPMTSSILAVLGVLGALGGLITILSGSLIINTLNALLVQQLRQIGVMKLVGARSTQILGMYLALVVAYGSVALLLAVPLGALAGYALAAFVATLMGAVLQGFRVIPAAIGAQALVTMLIPLGAGFFPVNSGARTSVQEAISNYRVPGRATRSGILSAGTKQLGWVSRPLLLSFRNTFRKRGRLLLTIFTLTVAGAVFIAVFNVRDSMRGLMGQIMQHFMGDVTVNFSQPYRVEKVTYDLLSVPGIVGVEGWSGAVGEIWDQNDKTVTGLSIAAPPQDTQLLHPEFLAGRWLLPGEKSAIVVSDTIYRFYPNLKPGDTLTVKLTGRQKEQWRVVGIFRFIDSLGDPLAYANFGFIADELHLHNQATSYRVIAQDHDAASQRALSRRIDGYLADRNFAVQSIQAGSLMQANVTQALNTLVVFLLIMAILTAFVGSIGLTGTMSINVLERTREIGIMRTIGAADSVIMQSVIVEGLVIGWITWFLAIGLSFPVSSLLLGIVGQAMMGSALKLSFTPLGIVIWLGVVTILSVVASIIPARNAARLTINEVLAYE
jgi:putative ABC transport system permease protein